MPGTVHILRTHYPHWTASGGYQQFIRHLGPEWKPVVHEVTKTRGYYSLPMRAARYLTRKSFRHLSPQYMIEDYRAERRLYQACRDGKVEAVHYLDAEHSLGHLPKWLSSLSPSQRPRLIGCFHLPAPQLEAYPPAFLKNLEALDSIALVNPNQMAFFASRVPLEKCCLLPLSVDLEHFQPGAAPPTEGGVFRCVTVGIHKRDDEVVLAAARALVNDARFEFHCVRKSFEAAADLPNVHVHAGISDAALLQLYQQAHLLFLPLTATTSNNTLVEAMACGLPILTTDLPGVTYYVGGEAARLIPSGNGAAAVRALQELADDPAQRAAMRVASRKQAGHFSWNAFATQCGRLYSGLAPGPDYQQPLLQEAAR